MPPMSVTSTAASTTGKSVFRNQGIVPLAGRRML
jgi:hypothetical protein